MTRKQLSNAKDARLAMNVLLLQLLPVKWDFILSLVLETVKLVQVVTILTKLLPLLARNALKTIAALLRLLLLARLVFILKEAK